MRLGNVTSRPAYPPRDGAGVRTYQLLRHLSGNHEVRQYAQARTVPRWRVRSIRELQVAPSYRLWVEANVLNGVLAAVGRRTWCGNAFLGPDLHVFRPAELTELLAWADVVAVEQPWQFAYCRRLRPDRPLVFSAHNVEVSARASHAEALGVRVSGNDPRLWWVRKVERRAVLAADLVIAVSEADRKDLIECYGVPPARVVVVPNGTDTRQITPLRSDARPGLRRRLGLPDGPLVVFMAAHGKVPDRTGLSWVRRMARRLPGIAFVVVGGVSPRDKEGNLIATGWVEDAVPYLRASDAGLCPIEHGGGTKLKLFDYLAAGLPVVAFEKALHGTSLRAGEHLLVCDSNEDALESAIRGLLRDHGLGDRLGAAGRAFVVQHHDWAMLAAQMERELVRVSMP